MSLVSIIVPVYNVEKYIQKCIESIINQVYKNIEVILINDGSTDSSGEICDYYAKINPRVKSVHTVNQGVSAARNLGIEYSRGEYIHFVDSDDTIDPEMINLLVESATVNQSDLVICGYKRHKFICDVITNTTFVEPISYSGDIKGCLIDLETIMHQGLIQGPCWKLYKKAIIENNNLMFPSDISFGEDTLFVYDYLINIEFVTIINRSLYNYLDHYESSLSTNLRTDKSLIYIKLYDRLSQVIKIYELEKIEKVISKLFLKSLISSFGELYSINCKITYQERIKILRNIIENQTARSLINDFDSKNINLKLMYWLMTKKYVKLMDLLFYLKKKISK